MPPEVAITLSGTASIDQSSQRPGNIEQIQALRYTRDFLRGLLTGEDAAVDDPERLYGNVCRALGERGTDDQLLAAAKGSW